MTFYFIVAGFVCLLFSREPPRGCFSLRLGAIEDFVTLFECDCLIEFPEQKQ